MRIEKLFVPLVITRCQRQAKPSSIFVASVQSPAADLGVLRGNTEVVPGPKSCSGKGDSLAGAAIEPQATVRLRKLCAGHVIIER